MMNLTLVLIIIFYCFALWLGLYLIQRDWRQGYLCMAGVGLVSYAVALGFPALVSTNISEGVMLGMGCQFFIYQPVLLWAGG